MPTYDYKCSQCKKVYTIVHPLNDNNKKECIKCGTEMTKKFGAIPASFKGEGFYTTDKFTDR